MPTQLGRVPPAAAGPVAAAADAVLIGLEDRLHVPAVPRPLARPEAALPSPTGNLLVHAGGAPPVPAPVPLAFLGLGAAALALRRT